MAKRDISLAAFYLMWGKQQGWKVPPVHLRACAWLEQDWDFGVLRAHRGFSKSTILAVYNAWRYYRDTNYRILHQSEADGTAYKTSRDTQNVLRNHPLTRGMFRGGGVQEWWVEGASDPRNASMYARGILSNVTSARADECQNDDVEVPRNIQTPEAREKLRYRLGEQVHILVPGGRTLFVGTPHTHDSLYDEKESMGASCLTIPMFAQEHRIEDATKAAYDLPFVPEFVFAGIHKHARLLVAGKDYQLKGTRLVLATAPGGLLDCYAGVAWPDRFDAKELEKRRKGTKTINEWDSQYQMHSRPIHEVRLDPACLQAYDCEPRFVTQNRKLTMWLGNVRVESCSARWDPSSGKTHSDASGFALNFQDAAGRHYWHRSVKLEGSIADTNEQGSRIIGGQVLQLCELIRQFQIPQVIVETNGIGGFAPSFLRMAIKQQGLRCGVVEEHATGSKNERILSAIEPLLKSGMLWAHVDVIQSDAWDEMKDWNPAVKEQADDLIDAEAGAITAQPVRIGKTTEKTNPVQTEDWRPVGGVYEAALD